MEKTITPILLVAILALAACLMKPKEGFHMLFAGNMNAIAVPTL
jgi:hypothetical protein